MEPTENKKNLPALKLLEISGIRHFPRTHLFAAGALGICLSGLLAVLPSGDAQASRQAVPLALNITPAPVIPDIELPTAPESSLAWQTLTIKSGDNLSLLFSRAGLSDRDIYELMQSRPEAKSLRQLHPGHQLTFAINEQGQLHTLRHIKNKLNSTLYQRSDEGFVFQEEFKKPDVQLAYREATITSSLIAAASEPGVDMDLGLTMELHNIFGWDIDFALDIRKGDNFKVLYEEKFLEGERLGYGDILAAEFSNQGQTYQAVRFLDEDGNAQYYTPEGNSMRKDFLRAPLDFRRISSNFDPRRLHPVNKTVRAHRGTDYAANTGTPVWAAGDGRVVESAYSSTNGNYVVLQHTGGVQTKYLHLHKRHVKKGERVKQKQVIGTVGSTGLATGPHLHYEFLLDGVHRNPRTIVNKLPKAKALSDAQIADFQQQSAEVLAQLQQFHESRILAAAASTRYVN